jgi:hypothetical protein
MLSEFADTYLAAGDLTRARGGGTLQFIEQRFPVAYNQVNRSDFVVDWSAKVSTSSICLTGPANDKKRLRASYKVYCSLIR